MSAAETFDVVVLGAGIGGLPPRWPRTSTACGHVLIVKSDRIRGTTSDSYGLIWVGNNHLSARPARPIRATTSSNT